MLQLIVIFFALVFADEVRASRCEDVFEEPTLESLTLGYHVALSNFDQIVKERAKMLAVSNMVNVDEIVHMPANRIEGIEFQFQNRKIFETLRAIFLRLQYSPVVSELTSISLIRERLSTLTAAWREVEPRLEREFHRVHLNLAKLNLNLMVLRSREIRLRQGETGEIFDIIDLELKIIGRMLLEFGTMIDEFQQVTGDKMLLRQFEEFVNQTRISGYSGVNDLSESVLLKKWNLQDPFVKLCSEFSAELLTQYNHRLALFDLNPSL